MPRHKTDAYKDGHKWIVFCVKCGQEDAKQLFVDDCNERYVEKVVDMKQCLEYKSGIAKSAV